MKQFDAAKELRHIRADLRKPSYAEWSAILRAREADLVAEIGAEVHRLNQRLEPGTPANNWLSKAEFHALRKRRDSLMVALEEQER